MRQVVKPDMYLFMITHLPTFADVDHMLRVSFVAIVLV